MNYNIQFQLAGFICMLILTVVFFSKKRWKSIQNSIYRVLLITTLVQLAFDIISVITIVHREKIPALNMFFSKGYLVLVITYISVVDLYTISNTFFEGMSSLRKKIKFAVCGLLGIAMIVAIIFILATELLFAGEGYNIYSYGIPSDIVYLFSTASVVYVLAVLVVNHRHVLVQRQISICSFCVMEGIVAIVQMFNKELLIVGFGMSMAVLIMYFTLENPDMDIIAKLNEANKRSHDLLLNILPSKIVDRMEQEQSTFTHEFNDVTVLFLDIVGFSKLSNEIGSVKIVKLLNELFSSIDDLLTNYSIEKIKTIGDSYMAAAGVPEPYEKNCEETIAFAKDILKLLKSFNEKNGTNLQMRIGINNGSAVAGIIGKRKFVYDLWGIAVNFASRMESYGQPNRINVSPSVYEKLKDSSEIKFEELGEYDIKGFGMSKIYAVV